MTLVMRTLSIESPLEEVVEMELQKMLPVFSAEEVGRTRLEEPVTASFRIRRASFQ